MEELSPLRGGLEELEEDILAYKENLSKLKSLGGAVVLKWGTKDRQEMQETRNNMQTENRKLEEDIRKKIDTLWNHNEGLGNDAAAFMRTALLEARQIEIDYIQKVQEQLIKLLKSLGVITTREYVEAVEDIGMLKPENVEDKDWNQVEERRQELGSLDKTLIILGETLISLERGNPKSKVEELDKKSETDLWTSKLKVAESVVETFLDSTLAKHLQGRRFKIVSKGNYITRNKL
ncbi:uncharacterized protein LOC111704631 [Eurytemora carolleeae]|uniref:uncharacterized protein LOC111704631 n=1 Tax=Eurytemora carolleeae TaxID=1294199 RepID=UPI000C766C7F|nr:uncharacterized protein LOC111704631 [Eurytemora carolleeae]|eukprot:XP_023332689.1 uncharacterized protein LOC111704631 [Eurytemora affinis]